MSKAEKKSQMEVPTYDQLMWPTLKALKELGGSASIQELLDKIIELENYPEEVQSAPHTQRETKLEYNAAWARTYLKKVGAINNSQRGVWVLLDEGEKLAEKDMAEIPRIVSRISNEETKKKRELKKAQKLARIKRKEASFQEAEENDLEEDEDELEEDWKDQVLSKVQKISPQDFERLCQLILRESGFTRVEVTGKTGDGGIDGIGILRVNLLSFHVSFQCKRYQGSVGAAQIRDFRGAFVGRGDKGLFITTGNFTADARKEASRDGAPAIDLIDGEELCTLLKNLKLGVHTELIEKVTVDADWFDEF